MAALKPGTFVRVLARDENYGKLGIVVEPREGDPRLHGGELWIEIVGKGPFGGVDRVFYHFRELHVAEELDGRE
jgi:hypothetical protein